MQISNRLTANAAVLLLGGYLFVHPAVLPARAETPAEAQFTVGAVLPLTGNAADQGEWSRNGLELAADELNAAPDGLRIKVVYEDSKGDPKSGIDVYNLLRLRYDIPAVFSWGSGVGLALTPLVNRDKVIQIGIATGTPDYRTTGDFTFRNFGSNSDEAVFADSVIDAVSGGGPVAIVKIQNDYGVGYGTLLRSSMEKRGKTVVLDETISPGETDFAPLLLRIKAVSPAAIALIPYPTEGALFLAQLRRLGMTIPVISGSAILGSRSFFDLAAGGAEGLRVIIPASRGVAESPLMKDFAAAYTKKFGHQIGVFNWYAARAYDALKVLAAARSRCGNADAICLRDQLFQTKDFVGPGGTISFDEAGDIKTGYSVVRIKGTEFLPE